MATSTVYPSTDLAGDWEGTQPLPVGAAYERPRIVGVDSAAYDGGDSAADAAVPAALHLPEIADLVPEGVTLVGAEEMTFTGSYGTSFDVPLTANTIAAGDLIEITCTEQEATTPPTPSTPSGYTSLGTWHDGTAYRPKVTIFYAFAAGGEESTNVTVTVASTRMMASSRVWRGVDPTTPYDGVTPAVAYGNANPNPPALDSAASAGAVVVCQVNGNKWGGTTKATQAAGFTKINDTSVNDRAFSDCYKTTATGGVIDPSAYTWAVDNSTAITYALRGGAGTDLVAVVITAVADDTATAELTSGEAAELPATNEVQQIVSVLTSGPFTLSYDGQTTGSLNWNDSAATIETALEALSNIGAGDVTLTGGPLNTTPILVEFTNSLAATDVSLLTASSGSVTITEETRGRAVEATTLEGSVNIPPTAGSNYGPQIHIWAKLISDYVAGDPIDITVADHDTLHSWAAALLICQGALLSNPISDTFGTDNAGSGASSATWGSITPGTAGSIILGIFAKGDSTLYPGTPPAPSAPARLNLAVQALGDGCTLSIFASGPADAVAATPSRISWGGGNEDYATGLIALTPAVAAGGTTLAAATSSEIETTWIELAHAAGDLYEVLELDVSGIPDDAVITSASVEIRHECDVSNSVQAVLCGINADDTIELCKPDPGFVPSSLGTGLGTAQTSKSSAWAETAEGTPLRDFSRFGIALISTSRHPNLDSHRIFWARATMDYVEGGPVVDSVTPPTDPGDPIAWTYSSAGGLAQAGYQIRTIRAASQDPTDPPTPADALNPDTGELGLDTGIVIDSQARSVTFTDRPLLRNTYTWAVRAFARLPSGELISSEWTTANGDISGAPTTGLNQAGNSIAFNPDTGAVDLTVDTDTGQTRAWLERSIDSGATYTVTEESPYTVAESTSDIVLSDHWAPLGLSTLRYRVSFDDGPHTETSTPKTIAGETDRSTVHDRWYLIVPDDPTLNVGLPTGTSDPVVADVSGPSSPRRSVIAEQPGGAVVAVSDLLPVRMALRIRTLNAADRASIEAVIAAGLNIRVVDIFGREWLMVETSGRNQEIFITEPLASETTSLRDAHYTTLDLIEVAGS